MLLWKNNNNKAGGLMSLPPEADYFSNYNMSQKGFKVFLFYYSVHHLYHYYLSHAVIEN